MKRHKPVTPHRSCKSPPGLRSTPWSLLLLPLLLVWLTVLESQGATTARNGYSTTVVEGGRKCPPELGKLRGALHHSLTSPGGGQPLVCSQGDLKHILLGQQGCNYNASLEDLWDEKCSAAATAAAAAASYGVRGGSGVGGAGGGAQRRAPATAVAAQPPDVLDSKKLIKINSLMKKAECKKKKVLLPIPHQPGDEKFQIEPCMVEVYRCQGCCSSQVMECTPAKIRNKTIPVLKLIGYSSTRDGREARPAEKYERRSIENHSGRCTCQCKVKEADCKPEQVYDEANCRCKCKAPPDLCTNSKMRYDDSQCKCVCKLIRPCSTGMTFDEHQCRCI